MFEIHHNASSTTHAGDVPLVTFVDHFDWKYLIHDNYICSYFISLAWDEKGRHGRYSMVVEHTSTNVISNYWQNMTRCTLHNILWLSLSDICRRSVVFSSYSVFLHKLTTTILLKWCWKWHYIQTTITSFEVMKRLY